MSETLQTLVAETNRITGAPLPQLLADDAPTLSVGNGEIYLIGLIGGKDVGKSTLINALAGGTISQPSSFGPGTERAIAYVHRDSAEALRAMLADVPEKQVQLRPHAIDALRRQVLIDLPDIDSKYADHAELTRKMLRHILFPLWLQSVEKYADQKPAQLLAAVAQGNDSSNFIFCLSKADQVDEAAAREIATDYAQRLMTRLKLEVQPHVLLVSSMQPDRFDLRGLRQTLQTQRSSQSVGQSTALATQRQTQTLRAWLIDQNLESRSAAAERTLRQAEELLTARVGVPLLESALPTIAADPAQRLWLSEPAIDARLSRWPIVSVIQGLAAPLIALVRSNLAGRTGHRPTSIEQMFAQSAGRSLEGVVQSVFAHLKQADPAFGDSLAARPLWESGAASAAVADLQSRLEQVAQRQREAAVAGVSRRVLTPLFAPIRWLLTIGVLLWFPLIQPVLSRYLNEGLLPGWHDVAKVLVPLLGASYLLQCAISLLIWFAALWGGLLWRTQRGVARQMVCWAKVDAPTEVSASAATLDWMQDLLRPLHERHAQANSLSRRVAAALG